MGAAPAAGGFEFGVNPDDDPELALALRVSMEEQRARQQAEGGAPDTPGGGAVAAPGAAEETSEVCPHLHPVPLFENSSQSILMFQEALLQRALAMSMDSGEPVASAGAGHRDLSSMTEEEQIAYAMQVINTADIANNWIVITCCFCRCLWRRQKRRKNPPSLNLWMWMRRTRTIQKS